MRRPDRVGDRPVCLVRATPSDQPSGRSRSPGQRVSQSQPSTPPDPSQGVVYICPMDPDVRSHDAGVCRRCGMTLVAGIPDPVEFHLDLQVIPSSPEPGRAAVLQFLVHDPWKDRPVSDFNVVHERFFHTFIVSEDLQFFEHGHPTLVADGVFQYPMTFPKAGMFRVLGDYYPAGATPQLTTDTVFVPGDGPSSPVQLDRDYSAKTAENIARVAARRSPTSRSPRHARSCGSSSTPMRAGAIPRCVGAHARGRAPT